MRYEDGPGPGGVITGILPRRNQLVRPPVANVDQAVVVVTIKNPDLQLPLLDRLLLLVAHQDLDPLVCLNKLDLCRPSEVQDFLALYGGAGYRTLAISANGGIGLAELAAELAGRVSVMAGQSGVGKSSILNALRPGLELRVGRVSQGSGRGRHTTRRVELLDVGNAALVADTPGFSRLDLDFLDKFELASYFPDMAGLQPDCRFPDCLHRHEPDCAVKAEVEAGRLAPSRYLNYLAFLEEIEEFERRKYS